MAAKEANEAKTSHEEFLLVSTRFLPRSAQRIAPNSEFPEVYGFAMMLGMYTE
ncbi:hypothetical protein ZHAS_00018677 [Anopheles sinensis]|uniref:Uncharacterized protein n=1 Tax=Anopheles sinensis TaxID=74873 RepID=A0A084WKA0_ANOSI|nr:hypothetical protein ZHAS_00018677 [Anopheles sinensis]